MARAVQLKGRGPIVRVLAVFHNKSIQALSGWIGVLVFVYAILGSLTPKWFGTLSWPQLILGALICAIVSAFILALTLAVGAWGFRVFRPLDIAAAEAATTPIISSKVAEYDDADSRATVERLEKTVRSVIDDYQNMSGLEAKLTAEIDALKSETQKGFATVRMGMEVIERKANIAEALAQKVEMIRVDGAIATSDIKKLEDKLEDHRDRALHSFFAIGAIKRLAALEATIDQDANDLYDRLKNGEIYDRADWFKWENVHSHWQIALQSWLETATWYAVAVKQKTLTVDDAKYGADWTVKDSQFPDAEAVRRFKKFRIIYTQWQNVVPEVQSGMDRVAFSGATEEDVRHGTPAG